MRVMQDNVLGEAFDNPLVLKTFIWRKSFLRIPLKASSDEVDKGRVWQLSELVHDISQSLLFLVLRQYLQWSWYSIIFKLREQLLSLGNLQD